MNHMAAGQPDADTRILNFSHPLTDEQIAQVEYRAGEPVARIIDLHVQIDPARPLGQQTAEIIDAAGLSSTEWQTLPLIINPPGYAPAALAIVAELHGRMGHFPTVLWIQPVHDSLPRRFRVADLISLQAVRDAARRER